MFDRFLNELPYLIQAEAAEKGILGQMFAFKFCETFRNTFFYNTPAVVDFAISVKKAYY